MKGHPPRKSNKILTAKELDDIQQPIDKDGYTNDRFDELYGKDKNPWRGTERDRSNRKSRFFFSIPEEQWKKIFGKKK
ncbi:MAG: hypothetical protein DRO11_08995 [Methanobacteriota archaeon]|nr:MAG: hypothetical protein DRO11_08995 [Euryarchaeota archaeon]